MASLHESMLVVLGTVILGGSLGALLFQRFKVPQVLGYIAIGLIIGSSGFGWVSPNAIASLQPLNLFALAVIGFLVGGELHRDTFREHGKSIGSILLWQGFGAFILVGVPAALLMYFVLGNLSTAIAGGLVIGAIASATDPATTMDVLWEKRCRGPLTTTLIAVVALDDAMAMALYALATGIATILSGSGESISAEFIHVGVDLGGACALGIAAGVGMNLILRYAAKPDKSLAMTVGVLLLVVGLAVAGHLDVIVCTMALGATLTNLAPRRSHELYALFRSFATPIYVFFFVMVGARLSVDAMPGWLWGIVAVYVVGRSIGKGFGAYIGARAAGAGKAIQHYSGIGLFAQGGVAVGLSIMASQHLHDFPVTGDLNMGELVVYSIAAATFIVQLTGPSLVHFAVKQAGETGRDVTEEDVIAMLKVEDLMDDDIQPVNEVEPLTHVFEKFSDQDQDELPVVGKHNTVTGVVSLAGLREVFGQRDTWEWLVARDVMGPVHGSVTKQAPLKDALDLMRDLGLDQVPITAGPDDPTYAGLLDRRRARKRLKEALFRQQSAVALDS